MGTSTKNIILSDLESSIQKKGCSLVWDNLGIKGSKLSIVGDAGHTDLIFWLPTGNAFFVEVKRLKEKPRKKQKYKHQQLKNLGFDVETHHDPISILEAVIKRVDTPRLPKEKRAVLNRAKERCALLRPRAR